MHFGFHLFMSKKSHQQARDGVKNPKQKIEQPAEQKPVEHAVVFIFYDGYRLDVDVGAPTFRTCHVFISPFSRRTAFFSL